MTVFAGQCGAPAGGARSAGLGHPPSQVLEDSRHDARIVDQCDDPHLPLHLGHLKAAALRRHRLAHAKDAATRITFVCCRYGARDGTNSNFAFSLKNGRSKHA